MATVLATVRRAANLIFGKGDAANLKSLGIRTIELAASASGTLVDFKLRVPTNARVDGSSRIYFDDLATSGSPTFNVGLYAVDGNTSDAATALESALAVSAASAATGIVVPADYANAGKTFWELASLSTDPGGFFDVKGQVKSAATNAAGTITLDLKTYLD